MSISSNSSEWIGQLLAFLGILAAVLTPFLFYWFTNWERIDVILTVETEHHPDCTQKFKRIGGTPRLEESRHDHMLKVLLQIANKGPIPIRIRNIEATGISDNQRGIIISHANLNGTTELHRSTMPSSQEELENSLPNIPIKREDPTWNHQWNLTYTGCENRPPNIDVTIKTERKIYCEKFKTKDCSHE